MTTSGLTLFEQRMLIPASPAIVFELLTTPQGLRQWIAREATVELTPDGLISWTHENGAQMVGRFREIVPPTRLVFSYGWSDGAMGMGPESTLVEITLTEQGEQTELHLVHRHLPSAAKDRHAEGWRYFLDRLCEAVD